MALWAEYMGAMRRVTELEDKLARKSESAMREVDDKNSCIARMLDEKAALCEIIGAQADTLAELRVENEQLRVQERGWQLSSEACHTRALKAEAQLAAMSGSVPYTGIPGAQPPSTPYPGADLPDPPRRADGTLAPQPKPWTPPKSSGDTRRIGS